MAYVYNVISAHAYSRNQYSLVHVHIIINVHGSEVTIITYSFFLDWSSILDGQKVLHFGSIDKSRELSRVDHFWLECL